MRVAYQTLHCYGRGVCTPTSALHPMPAAHVIAAGATPTRGVMMGSSLRNSVRSLQGPRLTRANAPGWQPPSHSAAARPTPCRPRRLARAATSPAAQASVPHLSSPDFFEPSILSDDGYAVRDMIVDDVRDLGYLMERVMPMVQAHRLGDAMPEQTKVVEFLKPWDLLKELDGLDQGLPDQGDSLDKIVECLGKTMHYSVRTGHPRYFDKLCHGSESVGQVAEFVTSVLNTNVHTYSVAPVFATLERACIKGMAKAAGFEPETSDGLLMPGGTFANITAVMIARHARLPHVRKNGYRAGERPVMFTSAQAHYSIARGAIMAGIGMDACVEVECDSQGRMIPSALDAAISKAKAEGMTPFFVSATAGTTVLGAYDPFDDIKAVIDRHAEGDDPMQRIWFHVDGAWGGSVCFSEQHGPALMRGVEKADSMSWNFQKGLGVPVYCAAILTNNRQGALEAANSSASEYIFHPHDASEWDLGAKSLQCGRRPDSLKLWLSWKRFGSSGFGDRIDTAMANAKYLAAQIAVRGAESGSFVLVTQPQYNNVCWWYIPEELRSSVAAHGIESVHDQLDDVCLHIREEYQRRGSMLLDISPLRDQGLPRFFRIILNMPTVTNADMDFVLDEIEDIGRSIDLSSTALCHDLC